MFEAVIKLIMVQSKEGCTGLLVCITSETAGQRATQLQAFCALATWRPWLSVGCRNNHVVVVHMIPPVLVVLPAATTSLMYVCCLHSSTLMAALTYHLRLAVHSRLHYIQYLLCRHSWMLSTATWPSWQNSWAA